MKKLFTTLAIVTLLGSTQAIASNADDGFNWPEGFSTEVTQSQQLQIGNSPGFNWPEGVSYEKNINTGSHAEVADGMNWPTGF